MTYINVLQGSISTYGTYVILNILLLVVIYLFGLKKIILYENLFFFKGGKEITLCHKPLCEKIPDGIDMISPIIHDDTSFYGVRVYNSICYIECSIYLNF